MNLLTLFGLMLLACVSCRSPQRDDGGFFSSGDPAPEPVVDNPFRDVDPELINRISIRYSTGHTIDVYERQSIAELIAELGVVCFRVGWVTINGTEYSSEQRWFRRDGSLLGIIAVNTPEGEIVLRAEGKGIIAVGHSPAYVHLVQGWIHSK